MWIENKKPRKWGRIVLLVAVIGLISYHFKRPSPPPGESLSQAAAQIGKDSAAEVKSALKRAMEEKAIQPWALLLLAQQLESEEKTAEAIEKYKKIPEASPASLDAKLALFRLSPPPTEAQKSAGEYGRFVSQLEEDIRLAKRQDLLPDLSLRKSEVAEQAGNIALAVSGYRETWQQYVGSEAGKRARQALARLSTSLPPKSMADLLSEAKLLLKENLTEEALSRVQVAKEHTSKQTPAYFEALLVEEEITRKSGKTSEADHLLSIVSADGPHGIADQALLQLAKNHWNSNKSDAALDYVHRFSARFPVSPRIDEALYIKGRILEEKGQLSEARAVYRDIADRSADPQAKLRALRQAAWINLREKSYSSAAELFHSAKSISEKAIRDLRTARTAVTNSGGIATPARGLKDLQNEFDHAAFWLAYSVRNLEPKEQQGLSFKTPAQAELLEAIANDDPYGYYRFLAEGLFNQSSTVKIPQTPVSQELMKTCSTEVPAALLERLAILSEAKLLDFVRYEIDWYFAKKYLRETTNQPSLEGKFRDDITKAALYGKYSLPKRSIGFTEYLLGSDTILPQGSACEAVLFELSFPLPYLEQFMAAANRYNVPLPLLLAVARTESHFDPQALSLKNAQGLLQLLPSTAKEEGLVDGQDLFEPSVNIELGAKHLSRLLTKYGGEEAHAIAAYNAGATAVERWKARYGEIPLAHWIELIGYPETKNYVKHVLRGKYLYDNRLKALSSPSSPPQGITKE